MKLVTMRIGARTPEATQVGQAMTFTSFVLSLGFLVFVLSAYIPLTNFGILSAVAITSALFADLFLMPALIDLFIHDRQEKEETLHEAQSSPV